MQWTPAPRQPASRLVVPCQTAAPAAQPCSLCSPVSLQDSADVHHIWPCGQPEQQSSPLPLQTLRQATPTPCHPAGIGALCCPTSWRTTRCPSSSPPCVTRASSAASTWREARWVLTQMNAKYFALAVLCQADRRMMQPLLHPPLLCSCAHSGCSLPHAAAQGGRALAAAPWRKSQRLCWPGSTCLCESCAALSYCGHSSPRLALPL